jgi:hypothetical protein
MKIKWAGMMAAALALGACGGGGQTEATEAEQALSNDYQPAAPSPGAAGPVPDGSASGQAGAVQDPVAGEGQVGDQDPVGGEALASGGEGNAQ